MIPLRDENPTHRLPFFTVGLIVANFLVFFHELGLGHRAEAFVANFGAIPFEVIHHQNLSFSRTLSPYLSLLTSMFVHGGWAHVIGNMWFLWIFGDNIEDFLGHFGFLVFYLATGLLAALTHVVLNPDSRVPMVGASGAISGVLGAYIVLHPRIRIRTLVAFGLFFDVIRVPAIFFLGIWFLMQFLGQFQPGDSVAYAAHIGGFVAGAVLILFCSRKDPAPRERYEFQRRTRW